MYKGIQKMRIKDENPEDPSERINVYFHDKRVFRALHGHIRALYFKKYGISIGISEALMKSLLIYKVVLEGKEDIGIAKDITGINKYIHL